MDLLDDTAYKGALQIVNGGTGKIEHTVQLGHHDKSIDQIHYHVRRGGGRVAWNSAGTKLACCGPFDIFLVDSISGLLEHRVATLNIISLASTVKSQFGGLPDELLAHHLNESWLASIFDQTKLV